MNTVCIPLCAGKEPFQLPSYIGGRMEFRGSLVQTIPKVFQNEGQP